MIYPYNRLFVWRRLAFQIMLGCENGLVIDLFPQIVLGFSNRSFPGIGFEWICGKINFGFMTKEYQRSEKYQRDRVRERAEKMGITEKQARLMYRAW